MSTSPGITGLGSSELYIRPREDLRDERSDNRRRTQIPTWTPTLDDAEVACRNESDTRTRIDLDGTDDRWRAKVVSRASAFYDTEVTGGKRDRRPGKNDSSSDNLRRTELGMAGLVSRLAST